MVEKKHPKAPAGCYWRGNVLWAQQTVNGERQCWSLETDDPAVAVERRGETAVQIDVGQLRRKVSRLQLSAAERTVLFWAIDIAAARFRRGRRPQ